MKIKVIVSVLLLLLAGVAYYFLRPQAPPTRNKDAYYYNLDSRKVFVAPADQYSPIITNDGKPNGVRIYIFSHKTNVGSFAGLTLDQVKAGGGIPGWLESYTPEAREKLAAGTMDTGDMISAQLNRAVDGGPWYPAMSSIASRLRDQARQAAAVDGNLPPLVNP